MIEYEAVKKIVEDNNDYTPVLALRLTLYFQQCQLDDMQHYHQELIKHFAKKD